MKEFIKKLHDLEISILLIDVKGEMAHRKLYKGRTRITEENMDQLDLSLFNFLVIDLKSSGLICLDIEGHKGSVEAFNIFIESKKINKEKYLIEKTRNNGLHLYFKNNFNITEETHWNKLGKIHFDVLTKNAFTSPSNFRNKKYEWIENSILDLNSKEEIPDTPIFVLEMMETKEKYFKPTLSLNPR